ncbi:hypothetical protein PG997_014121 [Apiospora hydei]|uniref:Ankyrin n=1 Tax=Apiospora hydei TaxID=1337664 RepID=A0ABR1V840_9PEZI
MELTMVLSTMTRMFDRVYIIVDALDECGEYTASVVETLASYANDHDNLCAALLSRDEDEIRFGEDVAEYVSSEIQERVRTGRLRVGDDDLLSDIQRELVAKAHGMFRWVTCQLDHLGECHSDRARREALDTLPPDLEETYVRLLRRIRPSQESLVAMTLNFVGYISKDLSIPMLQHAVSIRPDQRSLSTQDIIYEEAISRACSSLVRKTNDGEYFEFAHFSVREFLESERLDQIQLDRFRISRSLCSEMFASQCLRYIQLENFIQGVSEAGFKYRKAFDRQKTKAFIGWAVYLLHGLHDGSRRDSTGNYQSPDLDLTLAVHDERFTPLHLAAILGLSEICQKLLSEGADPGLPSQLGTLINCAVSSIGALHRGEDLHSLPELPYCIRQCHRADAQTNPHDVSKTVCCILEAQRSTLPTNALTANPTLMRNALATCGAIADFSMISTLFRNGVEPADEDRQIFEDQLLTLCQNITDLYTNENSPSTPGFVKSALETRLEAFIRSLNSFIHVSPSAFAFCSLAWMVAMDEDVSFTSDMGSRGGDINKLKTYLDDPRISSNAQDTQRGFILLHWALEGSSVELRGLAGRLTVTHQLLESGYLPTAVDLEGQTPLHVWSWREDTIDETQQQELEDLMRDLLEKGASIQSRDGSCGATALHNWASHGSIPILRAALHVASADDVETALAMIDNDGALPLMKAIESSHIDTANLILCSKPHTRHDFETLDRSKLLSLAGGIKSASLLCDPIALGFPIISDDGDTALHHVKGTTTAHCIKVLKEHLPDYCDKRADGRLPVEGAKGHEQCAEKQIPYLKAIEQLTTPTTLTGRDENGLSVWNYAVTCVHQDETPSTQRCSVVCTGLGYALQLGYMKSHEKSSSACGLIPLIKALDLPAEKPYESWSVSPEFLMDVINVTDYWPQFRDSPMALDLLKSSYYPSIHVPLFQLLLEKGVFPGNHEPCEALRSIRLLYFPELDERYNVFKEQSQLILDRAPKSAWNTTDPAEEESGLIHCTRSVWLTEELIRRGADPNLRTSLRHGNVPALVHHILRGRPKVALCLLKNGARADETGADGVNAMHAAVITGNLGILESILPILSFTEHPSWISWCTWACYGEAWTLNLLHLNAFIGQLDCMKFLFQNDKAGKFKQQPDRAWQAMHLAAMGGHDSIIRYMHQHGFNINTRWPDNGFTPLHSAVNQRKISAIEELIGLGAEFLQDRQGKSPLYLAMVMGFPDIVEIFDRRLAKANDKGIAQPSPPPSTNHRLLPLFEKAVQKGDITLCQRLHRLGCLIDGHLTCGGCSLLILALSYYQGPVARWLIEEGACPTKIGCAKHGGASIVELCLGCTSFDIGSTKILMTKYIQQGGDILDTRLICSAAKKDNVNHAETTSKMIWQVEGVDILVIAYYATENTGSKAILADYIADALPVGEPCPPSAIIPLFHGKWKTRLAGGKFCSTSMWKSLDIYGETPIMICSRESNLDAMAFLVNREADYQKTNINGESILHLAAEGRGLGGFSLSLMLGVDPHIKDIDGISAIHKASAREGLTATLVNHDLRLGDTDPIPWSPCVYLFGKFPLFHIHFRLYQRKLGKVKLLRIANLHPGTGWSPLCLMTLRQDLRGMGHALDIGATIDHEGSSEGSALMVACTAGAFAAAKFLVRRGASICYVAPDGQSRSSLVAATASSSLAHWLLVDRFVEQPKICFSAAMEREEEAYKPWSGGTRAGYLIMGSDERDPSESSFDYYKRLMEIRRNMRGKVVPPADRGKASRPSRLIPVETIRRHPEDMRSPRDEHKDGVSDWS